MASADGIQYRVAVIPITKIRENPVALREVDKESEEYLGLVDSIKEKGLLNPLSVREFEDPTTKETLYGLIDGLHRYHGSLDAGLKEIPVSIRTMDQAEVEEAQIIGNVHKVETKAVEYTKQLERLMMRNPLMTVSELAKRLAKSTEWLYQRFGLLKLDEKWQQLVDEGKIKLNNAYQLSKLPKEDQESFVEKAMTLQPSEFVPMVGQRIKEIKEARRQGRAASPPTFSPVPNQRKWSEVKAEYEQAKVGPVLISELKVTDPVKAFALAIAWVANMDPKSQEAQIQRNQEQKEQKEQEKLAKQRERAEKRAKDAQEALAKLEKK